MSDGCPDCQHSLTIHDADGCRVCDCRRPSEPERNAMTQTEPVRLFGYTATGLALLAIGVATAALESATWKEGVLAAMGALAAGLGGTEKLRSNVWAPANHAAAVTAVARGQAGPSAGDGPRRTMQQIPGASPATEVPTP